jgi:hypothetical protein
MVSENAISGEDDDDDGRVFLLDSVVGSNFDVRSLFLAVLLVPTL